MYFQTQICPVSVVVESKQVRRLHLHSTHVGVVPRERVAAAEWMLDLQARIKRHMAGKPQDFSTIPVNLDWASPFAREVYTELRRVPAGETVTYGELAARVGRPTGARAVSRAMASNQIPLLIPCHRVVGAKGNLTGFSGADGVATKAQMLWAEGRRFALPSSTRLQGSIYSPFMFDLALYTLGRESSIKSIMEEVGKVFPEPGYPDNPFASLIQTICYQQLAGAAAESIFSRVKDQLGGDPEPDRVLLAGMDGLRATGLSGSKAATMLALAGAVSDGDLVLSALASQPYDEMMATLTAVKGIGPWTIQMFAMFHLGHPDVFSPGDLGLRKAITALRGARELVSLDTAERFARRWRPFRTVASWYLWRSLGTVTL
jgi:O-6-methylguanine DNA methyltransferase